MKSFGKGLFWIGFILLMGVVIGYLITMLAGVVAFASLVTALTFCGLILVGGIFMLSGRAYERKGEIKSQLKDLEAAERNFSSTDTAGKTTL